MFFSHFKEAKMGPDEPFELNKIDPQVFESAMRWAITLYCKNTAVSFV
jgi:hypothetical protein